jgi:hypothetical protein
MRRLPTAKVKSVKVQTERVPRDFDGGVHLSELWCHDVPEGHRTALCGAVSLILVGAVSYWGATVVLVWL